MAKGICPTCNSEFKAYNRKRSNGRISTQKYCSTECRQDLHGLVQTKLYNKWAGIKGRCLNPRNPKFVRYGARGIAVCERWVDFKNFYQDMQESYYAHCAIFGEKDTQIDRIDNNKGYYKENCRWATMIENANNKGCNRRLSFRGEVKTLTEWGRELGITKYNLENRIFKYGWSVERALSTPVSSLK